MDKRGRQTIGWKTYTVAALSILAGLYACSLGLWADGVKGIIFGLALIALRDALGKLLRLTDENRKALDNLRAAADSLYSNKRPPII